MKGELEFRHICRKMISKVGIGNQENYFVLSSISKEKATSDLC